MSIKIMSKVWEHYPCGGTELLSLLALADWSDDEGRCFPSMAAIAKKTRLQPRQAQRLVHKLIDDGYVRVTGNKFGGAPGTTRQYQIVIDRLTGVTQDRGVVGDRGVTQDADGCHGRRETGVTHDTQTIIEPSLTFNGHFAVFWNAYPKKKHKGDAEKAFKSIRVNGDLLGKMLSAIASQKQTQQWQKDNGQFIPYPATWLRAKGWEDEPSDVGASGNNEFVGAV